jgi:hypothetical protein
VILINLDDGDVVMSATPVEPEDESNGAPAAEAGEESDGATAPVEPEAGDETPGQETP